MATHTAHLRAGISIGDIFGTAFSTIGSNPVVTLGAAFLFGALPELIYSLAVRSAAVVSYTPGQPMNPMLMIMALAGMLVSILIAQISQGALMSATAAHEEGRAAGFADMLSTGLRAALPLLLLGIVIGIAVTLGTLLFLVPGLILYIMWSVAAPALVEERCGIFQALGRSRALTKGARWSIFALQLLVLLGMWLVSAALGGLLAAIFGFKGVMELAAQGMPLWYSLIGSLIRTALVAVMATVQCALYLELRAWKEGPASGALSEIFA